MKKIMLTGAIHPNVVRKYAQWSREHQERGCGDAALTFDAEGLAAGVCSCVCADHLCAQTRQDQADDRCACGDTGVIRNPTPTYWHPDRWRDCPLCYTHDGERAIARLGADVRRHTGELFAPDRYTLDRLDAGSAAREGAGIWLAGITDAHQADREPARPFLTLSGPTGTGKTHAALGIAITLARSAFRPIYATGPGLLDDIKATYDAEGDGDSEGRILTRWKEAEVAIIDDLGAEQSTEWSRARLLSIIDARWAARRLTVVTTNLTAHTAPADRTWSRVMGDRFALVVTTKGRDRRRLA